MSVDIVYSTGTQSSGNQMFQYFAGLIYAHKNGLVMKSLPGPDVTNMVKLTNISLGDARVNHTRILSEDDFDENGEIQYYGRCNYIITSFFQNANYFNQNVDILFKYVSLYETPQKCLYPNDVVLCHIRMADFRHNLYDSEILAPDYFINIWNTGKYSKLLFNFFPPNDPLIPKYLSFFQDIPHEIMSPADARHDFNQLSAFKHVALSNSTFHWWSGFFNCDNIETLYTPKYMGSFGLPGNVKCHGKHIKNLCDIRGRSIPIEHSFFDCS